MVMIVKRITKNITSFLEIKKSKFITQLFYVTSVEQVNQYLLDVKKEYKDATHYCYAYIIDDKRKASDDKEPSGTAGIPMMEVLNKQNLNYILCVVVRYFGGIKLGAGGLTRAYSNSIKEALKNADVKELEVGYRIKIQTDYKNENRLIELLGKENILKKEYKGQLEIEAIIKESKKESLTAFHIEIIEKIWI